MVKTQIQGLGSGGASEIAQKDCAISTLISCAIWLLVITGGFQILPAVVLAPQHMTK